MTHLISNQRAFMSEPIRLSKRLIELTACSRREAELYITGGWVTVDGQVVEEPGFTVTDQKVQLHPDANAAPVEPATILFHHTQQAKDDTQASLPSIFAQNCALTEEAMNSLREHCIDENSGIAMLKQHFFKLTQCTPLERDASGLSVYTQNWRVARKLQDDAATIEQEYVVEVSGELSAEGLKLLNFGLKYNGRALSLIKVSWQNETRLRFALKGVVPGQIAYACRTVGLEVLSMKRIRIGRVAMAKLPPGCWRYLMPHERF